MFDSQQIRLVLIVLAMTLMSSLICRRTAAAELESDICDVQADYFLGVEDYRKAILIHREILHRHPDNALAHYHLGFAEGMIGNRAAEIAEYRRAEILGFRNWDLYLNLGLAEFETGNSDAAMDSLQTAALRGAEHPETHLDLALVEERLGILVDAEREILVSLRLNPEQADARNLLGVIYAREGETARAAQTWRQLTREVPGYEPARVNLSIILSRKNTARGQTAAATSNSLKISAH